MARPIDIHLPGGTILLTPPGLLPDRLIGSKFAIRDGRALARLRASRTGLSELRREFHLLELHHDARFAGDLVLLGALEQAVARRRLDLHWLPEDCASEVTPRADLRDRVPRHVRDWFAAEKVREALTRARPRMRRKYDRLMEQLLEPKHLVVGLPLILDLAEPKGGGELMAFAFSAGRWEGLKAMEAFAKATAECVVADDERMLERAADAYADALTGLDSLVLGRFVARLGTKGIQPNAPPVESKIRSASTPAARPAPVPGPRPEPKPAPKAEVKPLKPEAKPEPKTAPAATPACKLVKLALSCEHGRTAGPQNILMVVPRSAASFGDKVSGVLTMDGGCGQHPAWTVSGHTSENGKGAKFNFNAAKWAPSGTGLFWVRGIDPHVYSVSGSACSGQAASYEVRAYPPGNQALKVNIKPWVEKLRGSLQKIGIPKEKLPEVGLAINGQSGWKEDEKSWKAFCEFELNGEGEMKLPEPVRFQPSPLNIIPQSLQKYTGRGLCFEINVAIKIALGLASRYWPDIDKTKWSQTHAKIGGAVTGALVLEIKLASSEIVEGSLVGEIGIECEGSAVCDEDITLQAEMKWPGLKCKATLKAAWGYVEYTREWQIFPPGEIWKSDPWKLSNA